MNRIRPRPSNRGRFAHGSTRLSAGLLLAALVGMLGPSIAAGQTPPPAPGPRGIAFAVSPPTFELTTNPGEKRSEALVLENQTSESHEVTVRVVNFVSGGERGEPNFTEEKTPYSLAGWVTVSPLKVQIPAKTMQYFDFTLNLPADAEPGGHYAAIIFRSEVPFNPSESSVNVVHEIGALILLRVPGDVVERASIVSFRADKDSFDRGPIALEARIRNEGNVHFKPTAVITIDNIFGRRVANIPLKTGNVLPDSVRRFDSAWKRGWLWGPYRAKLTVLYGDGEPKVLRAWVGFFGFPLVIVLALLLSILLAYLRRLHRRARQSAKPATAAA